MTRDKPYNPRRGRRDWYRLAVNLWTALVVLFLLAPSIVVVINSLGTQQFVKFPPTGLTLKWYGAIPRSFVAAFLNSIKIGLLAALGGCALGVPAAFALVRGGLPGRNLVDAILRSPLQVPWLVTGVAFLNFYGVVGRTMGLSLRDSFMGLVLAHLLCVIPYIITAVVARLAKFDERLEEAAAGLGADSWTTFWSVTFPIISPAIFAGAFMAFIVSFDNVPVSLFLTGTNTTTFPVALYFSLENELSRVQYAVATLATIFSTILVMAVHRWGGKSITGVSS